jgi:hypothetical protein
MKRRRYSCRPPLGVDGTSTGCAGARPPPAKSLMTVVVYLCNRRRRTEHPRAAATTATSETRRLAGTHLRANGDGMQKVQTVGGGCEGDDAAAAPASAAAIDESAIGEVSQRETWHRRRVRRMRRARRHVCCMPGLAGSAGSRFQR